MLATKRLPGRRPVLGRHRAARPRRHDGLLRRPVRLDLRGAHTRRRAPALRLRRPRRAPRRRASAARRRAAPTGGWTTYIWVDSADETAAAGRGQRWPGARRRRSTSPVPAVAVCADPSGAVFGLWQAADNRGAQLVNAPGSWNFSELNVRDPGAAEGSTARCSGGCRDLARDGNRPTGVDVAGEGVRRLPRRARPRDPRAPGG